MSKRYRLFFIAVAGLILSGASAPPESDQNAENSQTENEISEALGRIERAISNIEIPTDENPACDPGEDNRNSDLCAQWKAADSAREAASYAWAGLLVGIVGTAMLIWTFLEQRRTSRAQLRAYIAVDAVTLYLNPETGEAVADLQINNTGQTPAFHTVWAGNIRIADDGQIERDLAVTSREQAQGIGRPTETAVSNGRPANATIYSNEPLTQEQIDAGVRGEKALYVFGYVWYEDAFGKKRVTEFCFRAYEVPPSSPKVNDPVEMRWYMAPFHNNAT
ncbi:hypothetical protein [Croceicoccus sp. Ery5]|uniref:hypothetical protein n=1 Tax=Croceicoccus sp. Ery5 TaxID=1703340 RepID=UPI001E5AD0B6|nr:hypothetical protein [Croceicoccus sp. Ery5]